MSGKRVTLLCINSLTTLSKVRNSRNSLDFIKVLAFANNLSTATQISDFQNPDVQYQQNHSEFYADNQNPIIDLDQKPNGHARDWGIRGNNKDFQPHPDGFYGGNSTGLRQSSTGVGGQNPINEFQLNLVEQIGNLSGGYGVTEFLGTDLPSDNITAEDEEKQHNPVGQSGNFSNGYGGENHIIDFQHKPIGESGNHFTGMSQESENGHYGGSAGQFQYAHGIEVSQQYPSNYYTSNTATVQQSPGQYSTPYPEKGQQMTDYYPTGNTEAHHYQQSSGGFNGVMLSSDGLMRENVGEYQQNANVEQYQQNSNDPIEQLDGFIKEGRVEEAVGVLKLLEDKGIPVDLPRYLALMRVCGEAKALQEAKFIHEHLVRSLSPLQVQTCNKILEMYAECGSMGDAFMVFEKMLMRNLTSWDTMITWLAKRGQGEDAIDLFTQFKETGLKPDGQLFIAVFSACGALGDMHEGMLHFESMSKNYGIAPSMEHYVSVVDMLGSTGYVDEALEFIESMPIEPSVDVWETLMNLCRVHGNVELGDRCAEFIELLDPSRLSEKSKAGLIPEIASNLAKEKEKEKKKLAGEDLIDARSRIYEYRAGDKSHPDSDKIYALLRGMKGQMKEAGYVPETRFVLHDIDQEGKEEALLSHSERLAVAQGLITSSARSPLRIIKNLRVCGDCHTALKIISKLVGRELIIRDAKRFHHFKDGLCSCGDYW